MAPPPKTNRCPLCTTASQLKFILTDGRDLFECLQCGLAHVDPSTHLSESEEKLRYELHENRPDDPEYLKFLSQLSSPLIPKIPLGSLGLDYGSGPGPAMDRLFQGHEIANYDPFFSPRPPQGPYDFITCSEAAEHFADPRTEFFRISELLKPGGWFGLMTSCWEGKGRNWHYFRDPTHVCFFSSKTLSWIGKWLNWKPTSISKNVTLFQKAAS